jgi:superfamily I DNA/RNA helicase
MIAIEMDSPLTVAQAAAVEATGNVFVDAGPGTGKTHVIVARIRRLVASGVDPRSILVLTFSRRAVAELRERIAAEAAAPGCEVRTFHGFASRVLEADGPRFKSRRLLDAFAEDLLLRAALRRSTFETLPEHAVRSERFRHDVGRFVADLRRSGAASVERLRAAATPRLRDVFGAYDRLRSYRETLRASDLDDLIARATDALGDPASPASEWLAGRYAHVLLDEFQDVDATQLDLVGRLKGTLFAVGDAAQAIYGFRGAVSGAIEAAIARFGMQRMTLDESRRCPAAICSFASRTPFLDAKPLVSLRDVEGSIDARAARTTLDEAAFIADRIEDAIAAGVAPERIAVLLRTMQPLGPAVEAELRTRTIAVAGGGRSAFLADPNVETLRLALRLLDVPSDLQRWVAFLASADLGFDVLRVHGALRDRPLHELDDGLAALEAHASAAGVVASAFGAPLRAAAEAFAAGDIGRAARRIVNGFGLAARAARAGGDVSGVRAGVNRLGRVIEALAAAQRHLATLGEPCSSGTVLGEFESRIETIAGEETPADDVPGVRLLTIHGAKGLEFDFVIVGDAVEGRFPASSRRSTLFDADSRRAAQSAGVDLVEAREDATLREEASLWYVAATRSRDALLITYAVQGADGTPQRPSRFLPAAYHQPEGIAPFERRLDRIEETARKSGDAGLIATLRHALADSPGRLALLDEGEAAFAPLPERPVVYARDASVSAAETWLQCPRRFYYKHVLGLADETGLAAEIGNALHAILATFHGEFCEFLTPATDAEVATWIERLRALRVREWQARTFEPASKADASARFADRVLGAYAVSLRAEARRRPFSVVACELTIESAYGPGVLRGKLDRVDRDAEGNLVVRDYKSGRRPITTFEKLLAKETKDGRPLPGSVDSYFRPQLALYRAGVEAAFDARVARLEYVYLNGIKNDETSPIGVDAIDVDATTAARLAILDERIERDFVAAFANGVAGPIATAADAQVTCRNCSFTAVCPRQVTC